MLHILRNRKKTKSNKPRITLTARLVEALVPGKPALFLYNGELIRTSTVQTVLEAQEGRVSFETRNSIYTLSHDTHPMEGITMAA